MLHKQSLQLATAASALRMKGSHPTLRPAQITEPAVSEASAKKILVVDDDPDMVASLARALRASQFTIECAYSGSEAVTKNSSCQPDAIIMDIRMSQMDGIEACAEIQRHRPNVLIILMTGFSEALDEATQGILGEACRNGLIYPMMKPLDLDRVVSLLEGKPAHPTVEIMSWLDKVDR